VAKLSPDGSTLAYATYLGGNGYDTAAAIAVDSSGNVYWEAWPLAIFRRLPAHTGPKAGAPLLRN